MATFELGWIRNARSGARQLVFSRIAPLYVAGLLAGAVAGVGLATLADSGAKGIEPNARALSAAPATELLLPKRPVAARPSTLHDTGPELFVPAGLPPFNAESARYWEELQAALLEESLRAATEVEPSPPPAVAPQPASPPSAPVQPAPSESTEPAPPPSPVRPNFYVPEVPRGPATDLEWRLFAAANAEREKAGLPPLIYDQGLSVIARTRVQQLVDQEYFAHVDPYGYRMYVELLAYFGYTTYAWAGENLAMNNYSVSESPERAMVALMNSPSHRANILSADFSRLGVGELTTPDGRHFYAMIFLG